MYLEQLAHSDSKQGGSNKAIHMYVCGYCIAVAESKRAGYTHVLQHLPLLRFSGGVCTAKRFADQFQGTKVSGYINSQPGSLAERSASDMLDLHVARGYVSRCTAAYTR